MTEHHQHQAAEAPPAQQKSLRHGISQCLKLTAKVSFIDFWLVDRAADTHSWGASALRRAELKKIGSIDFTPGSRMAILGQTSLCLN